MNITDWRVGGSVATATTSSGLAKWLEWVPDDIGKLATVVGIALSLLLIVWYRIKMKQESRESALRLELLRIQIEKETRHGDASG